MHFSLLVLIAGLYLFSCSQLPLPDAHYIPATSRDPALTDAFPSPKENPLFATSEPLELKLIAPLSTLFFKGPSSESEKKKFKVKGQLIYLTPDKSEITIPVFISRKGFSTLKNCPFPKLEFKFDKKNNKGTLFENLKSVDFNTHCGEIEDNDIHPHYKESYFNHREAVIYRFQDILGIPSLKSRRVFVQYQDTDVPSLAKVKMGFRYQAFFLEDMSVLRDRLNLKDIKGRDDFFKDQKLSQKPQRADRFIFDDVQSSPKIDPEDLVRISLFQYMISNVDWYIKKDPHDRRFSAASNPAPEDRSNLWNIKIVEDVSSKWIVFPHDFNLSGFVLGEGRYTPRDKYFSSAKTETRAKVKQLFIDKKNDLYQALQMIKDDPKGFKNAEMLLNTFFAELDSL